MVIEGILTTENADGSMHLAPIGPHVNPELSSWVLKPFQSSTSFINLRGSARGVFHVVDDPLLMVAAVLGICNPAAGSPELEILDAGQFSEMVAAQHKTEMGWVLSTSCRCYALSVTHWDVSTPRAIAQCVMTKQEQIRPFWGWNRARHSILELAIVASRAHMLDRITIDEELNRHKTIIEKTAGTREMVAWELLRRHLSQ